MTLMERWQAFSPRERYLILAAGAMAVVVAGYYSVAAVFSGLPQGSAGDEDWAKVQKIENYRRIAARSDAVTQQAKLVEQRLTEQQGRLMSGATPTQVGAELQGFLSTLATEAALNVLSSQILREEEVEGFRRVGVRLTLSGTLEGVTEMLAAVEGGEHDLSVSNLEINRKLGATRRTTATRTQPATTAPLTVSLEVKTFLRQTS